MRFQKPYQSVLEFSPGGKSVPYGGGTRPDGDVNHGFRPIKGLGAVEAKIPETANDPALARCLENINAEETSFFTVGCLSNLISNAQGFRMSGYVEIAFNDTFLVQDARNYFVQYWHFGQKLMHEQFADPVQFHWELLGATFIEFNITGMTCPITLNSAFFPDEASAVACWTRTLEFLSNYLRKVRVPTPSRFY